MTWQFTLTGLGLGLIVGLTGVGGGSLMTPILIIVFGFKPTFAVGTDIFHGAIFKSFGAIRHRRLSTVHGRLALWLFAGSGPLAIAGVADIVEGGGPGPGYPQPKAARMMLADAATPVEAGTTEVSVSVTVTFRLA